MWNKIYLILLAAAIIVSGVLAFAAYSNLHSSGFAPTTIVDNYNYYANLDWIGLWISTLILLITANMVFWKLRKSWALWASLAYFAVSVIVQKFWLAQTLFRFRQENKLTDDLLSLSPFLAITFIVLMAIIIFFNQYIVKRLHDKMYPPVQPTGTLPEQPAGTLPEEIPIDKNIN